MPSLRTGHFSIAPSLPLFRTKPLLLRGLKAVASAGFMRLLALWAFCGIREPKSHRQKNEKIFKVTTTYASDWLVFWEGSNPLGGPHQAAPHGFTYTVDSDCSFECEYQVN